MSHYRTAIAYTGGLLLILATALRTFSGPVVESNPFFYFSFLAAVVLLYVTEPFISRRLTWYIYPYVLLQATLTAILMISTPDNDYFALVATAVSIPIMLRFPNRQGGILLAVLVVLVAVALTLSNGWPESLPFILVHVASIFVVGMFALSLRLAEDAQDRSQKLLTELELAHTQLKDQAAQSEELAAAQERNRLARELHDSVTQTIFSITLTAEAAQILLKDNPEQVQPQLSRLQALSESALAEMRSLILELRPGDVEGRGIAAALENHINALKKQNKIDISLSIEGESCLDLVQEQRLFRITQEALNNVIKHSGSDRAQVLLSFTNESATLIVRDEGSGFTPTEDQPDDSHIGLASMRERTSLSGGTINVASQPGEGTEIQVWIPVKSQEE